MSDRLRIAVAGVGAIGSVIAARLASSGHHVTLVARSARAEALRATGLRVDAAPALHLPVVTAEELGEHELLFTAVKEAAMAPLIASLRPAIGPRTTIVPLVNGVPFWFDGNPLAPAGIIGAVVFITATMSDDGIVHSRGRERLILGAVDAVAPGRLDAVSEALRGAGIETEVRADIRPDVWSKIALNLATNPLSVVSRASLAEQFGDSALAGVVGAVLAEVIALARSQDVEPSMTLAAMLQVGRAAGPFYTSMFQDFEAGRALELDAIGRRCVAIARNAGIPMPVAETIIELCAFAEAERDRARTEGA